MNNPSEFLSFAIDLAEKAGKIQLSYFGNISSLETKSTNIDLVTNADVESEELIISEIKKNYPKHSILSEESDKIINNSDYTWIIDPLDGTTNFTHNLPIFAVSIALKKCDKIECGVVFNPAADKCFYAEKNKGAYLNKKLISPTSTSKLSECLLVTGFPYLHDEKYDISFDLFKEFYDKTRGLRRLGSAALDLCFVGMGRFDGFYEFNLQPWDICAGALIASEAGALISDWNGEKMPYDGTRILCANKNIQSSMIDILNKEKYSIFY